MKTTLHRHSEDHAGGRKNTETIDMSERLLQFVKSLNIRFSSIRRRNLDGNVVNLEIDYRELLPVMHYLRYYTGSSLLQLISCVDWDEDNAFQISYIIWNQTEKIQLMLSFRIAKDSNAGIPSMIPMWPHAETFERELHEMFGIVFDGNSRQEEAFLLEDWDGPPPMLRSFDTLAYSNERFGERPGRHSEDTRRYIGRKIGEFDLSRPLSGE